MCSKIKNPRKSFKSVSSVFQRPIRSIQSKAPHTQSQETIKTMCLCVSKKNPRKSIKSVSSVFQNLRFSKQKETRNLKPETETQNE